MPVAGRERVTGDRRRRVVLRAQPFHSQVKFCYSGRAHPPEVCNFTWFGGRSPAVLINGVKNFEITDCDLYSAWIFLPAPMPR